MTMKTHLHSARRPLALAAGLVAIGLTALPSLAQETREVPYASGESALRLGAVEVAHDMFQTECAAGEATSCRHLGDLYRTGNGVTQDYRIADRHYQRSCDLGETAACRQLANLLFEGRGLDEDHSRARALYATGCERGDETACAVLGNMKYVGLGGPRERVEGAEMMRRACRADVPYACDQVQRYGIAQREGWQ